MDSGGARGARWPSSLVRQSSRAAASACSSPRTVCTPRRRKCSSVIWYTKSPMRPQRRRLAEQPNNHQRRRQQQARRATRWTWASWIEADASTMFFKRVQSRVSTSTCSPSPRTSATGSPRTRCSSSSRRFSASSTSATRTSRCSSATSSVSNPRGWHRLLPRPSAPTCSAHFPSSTSVCRRASRRRSRRPLLARVALVVLRNWRQQTLIWKTRRRRRQFLPLFRQLPLRQHQQLQRRPNLRKIQLIEIYYNWITYLLYRVALFIMMIMYSIICFIFLLLLNSILI